MGYDFTQHPTHQIADLFEKMQKKKKQPQPQFPSVCQCGEYMLHTPEGTICQNTECSKGP